MCITLFLQISLESLHNYAVERQDEKFCRLSQAKLKSGRLSSVATKHPYFQVTG